jgi:beta-lactamase class C
MHGLPERSADTTREIVTVVARLTPILLLAAVWCCFAPSALHASGDSSRIAAAVERAFVPLMKQHDVPGMAVGVTVNGRQYIFYYGTADKAAGTPVNADTLFEIGSVSKMFTATLAAYAQAQGKLWLADHPSRFMPELRGTAFDNATILNLGTYTAGGLPLHVPNTVKTNADMTAFLQKWKAAVPPGTRRDYSNPSAGLLGHLTALAMGGDFTALMQDDLLPKLGIAGCFIRVPETQTPHYAPGYRDNKPVRMGKAVFAGEAFGFKCNAAGMLRFVEANMAPDRLAPQLRRAVETTQTGHFRIGGMVQGFGWEQYPWPVDLKRLTVGNSLDMALKPNAARPIDPPLRPAQPTLYNKTGSTRGFGTYVAFVPQKNIGIVMLANTAFSTPARVTAAHAVLEELAPR